MLLSTAYARRSHVSATSTGLAVSLAPNLRRDRVSFSGEFTDPVAFREAIGALHDVVIDNRKRPVKDRSAYQTYLAAKKNREDQLLFAAVKHARNDLETQHVPPLPAGFKDHFHALRKEYWTARDAYAKYLQANDPALFRALVPCDPIVTVAADKVLFECFSKDESSYGCLGVSRDSFRTSGDVSTGTTNVDYSLPLYEQFQRLRSYRPTRFEIDPMGVGVATEQGTYREEQIELPPSWLRGFCQLQAAMTLPATVVPITREALYAVLAHLKRHKSRTSPRALRFELRPGQPVELVLEPWETRIVLHGTPWEGRGQSIRVWGRDRLRTLARLLPLMQGGSVRLLGTGLPSVWTIDLGDMHFTLALSGWTTNDWTSGGGALSELAPPVESSKDLMNDIATAYQTSIALSFDELARRTGAEPAALAAGLNRYALLGQLMLDAELGIYRWRSILPAKLALNQVHVESEESEQSRLLVRNATVQRDDTVGGLRSVIGRVGERDVEFLADADRRMVQGQCGCSHHFRYKLRQGPCRHLQALRRAADRETRPTSLKDWFQWLTPGAL